MKKTLLVLVSLLFASASVVSAAEKGDAPAKKSETTARPGKKAKAPETSAAKPAGKEDAKSKAAAAREERERTAKLNSPQRIAAARAKALFMFAMDTCDKPERCEPSLRDDAERRFLDACRACATAEKCEADRDVIRAGNGNRRVTPCDP